MSKNSNQNNQKNIKTDESSLALSEIMSINVDNLREKQYQALKKHVVEVLKKITDIIQNDGDLNKVVEMLAYSPAGDGYGCDNDYINFGIQSENENLKYMDIGDVCHLLHNLKDEKSSLNLPSDRF